MVETLLIPRFYHGRTKLFLPLAYLPWYSVMIFEDSEKGGKDLRRVISQPPPRLHRGHWRQHKGSAGKDRAMVKPKKCWAVPNNAVLIIPH
jgi:hypothetical protein